MINPYFEPAPMFWREHKFSPTFNDYELGPECPDACPDGWTSHTWQVAIEEHQVTLTTNECNVCSRGIQNGTLDDCLEMAPIDVTLAFDSDHGPDGYDLGGWHYDQRCDCNWWWTITPVPSTPENVECQTCGGDGYDPHDKPHGITDRPDCDGTGSTPENVEEPK